MMRMRILGLAVGLSLALPGAAAAATAYVDVEGTVTTGCITPSNPCQTIAQGLVVAGAAGEVIVDDGEFFSEQLTLDGGETLRVQEFDGVPSGGRSFLSGGAGTAITITAANATVSGFHITGDTNAVDVRDSGVTLFNNIFDEGASSAVSVITNADGEGLLLQQNTFEDSLDQTDSTTGVELGADALLAGNDFEDLNAGVLVTGPAAVVMLQNSFDGIHEDPGTRDGVGVSVEAGNVNLTILGGVFNNGFPGETRAVVLGQTGAAPVTAALLGTFIRDHSVGISITDTASVSLESVVVGHNPEVGLEATDTAAGAGGDVSATNTTFWGNGLDIGNQGAALTLDSSIVQSPIVTGSGASCAITFSRGPVTGPGCNNFQTTADPLMVGPDTFGVFDYALTATSPMIDAGNPAAPAPGAVDFQGQPRAIDGPPDCFTGIARRDIGADEFVPALANCAIPRPVDPQPDTAITGAPKAKVKTRKRRAPAAFTFIANESTATFECSVDGAAFAPCQSPTRFKVRATRKLKTHVFRVRAVDTAASRDATPAEYPWKVKRVRR
jgi:hypothetical protein